MIITMITVLSATAFAANSLKQGAFGISAGFNGDTDVISGRLLLTKDLAAVAGFGMTNVSGDKPTGTDFGLFAGIRKYLKVDDFAPFIEGLVQVESHKPTMGNAGDWTGFGLAANFGAECFLHKQFSLEGSIGAAIQRVTTNGTAGASDITNTILKTQTLAVKANFYF